MIEYRVRSADAWEALCIEQFQLCRLDWASPSLDADLTAAVGAAELSLWHLTAGPFGVSRTVSDVRRHDSDDLMMVLHDGGAGGRVEHRGIDAKLNPGDAVLIDTRSPYAFDFPAAVQQVVVKIPRARAAGLGLETGRVIRPADGPLGRVFRTILGELAGLDTSADQPGRAIEASSMAQAAVELLAGIYAADPSRNSGMLGHAALLRSAQEFVRSRYWEPTLTPDIVAAHLRVSPRLLARIFSDSGTTPAAFIRKARVDEAARMLRSSAHRNAAVFDVGARAGFPDATTFTRAFKREYGVVPSEFRASKVK